MGVMLQFHGCKWHGHDCTYYRSDDQQARQQLRSKIADITAYLEFLSYRVIEKWEYEWRIERKIPAIKTFLSQHLVTPYIPTEITGRQLINLVLNGNFFGMVECDIEVPAWDQKLLAHFKSMQPIFENAMISKDDIGDFMGSHATVNGLLNQPRRSLICSYFARKTLISTPLLRWYIQHGLRVSIQFYPKKCFSHLGEEVANIRRLADQNPAHKAKAEMAKPTGNSYYGKTMTDVRKHMNVSFVPDEEVPGLINDLLFRKMEEIGENAYEVSLAKRKIIFKLPTQIAYFVCSYAKLRMLEFYYDFMIKYLQENSFELVSMDIDSTYAAFTSESLDDLVKPELSSQYFIEKESFFSNNGL